MTYLDLHLCPNTPWIFAPPAAARLVVAESTFRPSLRPRASSNSLTEIRAGSRRRDKRSQLHHPELFLQPLEAGGLQELGVGRASRGFFARWIFSVGIGRLPAARKGFLRFVISKSLPRKEPLSFGSFN